MTGWNIYSYVMTDDYDTKPNFYCYCDDATVLTRDRIQESKTSFDAMISNSNLQGVPLLVLANKQDLPECMGVREVKPIFQDNADNIGNRDCMVLPTSGDDEL